MDKLINKYLDHSINRKENSIFLVIKQAFQSLIPIFIIGACALVIQNFPITAIREFVKNSLNGRLYDFFDLIYNATFGFSALYIVLAISYYESASKDVRSDVRSFSTISTVACYFAFLGIDVLSGKANILEYTKMVNIFSALITAFVFTKLFYLFYYLLNRNIKDKNTSMFIRSLQNIFPMLICLLISSFVAFLIGLIPNINNFSDLILYLLRKPFESIGATYFGGLLIMFLESVFWMLGIHGGNVFDSILTSQDSVFAFANGQIMTKSFIDTFVLMGGCGTSISLFLALLLFSKDKKRKKLCYLAGGPLLFNINELLVFGIPLVLNPIYLIPFTITPLITYSIAYFATYVGIVPQIINDSVQWTTPIIISGYQATGSIAGSFLQIFLIAIGVLIYVPFVKFEYKFNKENENRFISNLTEICKKCENQKVGYKLNSNNLSLHSFEEDLASKLSNDIYNHKIHLCYQPQIKDEKIISCEALLRFKFNDNQYLYPPLVVGIAINRDLFEDLSKEIVDQALTTLKEAQAINKDFKIAINLNLDLLMKPSFHNWLIEKVKNANVTNKTFGIEITEDANLSDSDDYLTIFNLIKQSGIEISMDDFSMGHTSISLLQKNYFEYVKIDGNLIKNINNERSKSIVESIVKLGNQLDFNVIAEYVETNEQKEILSNMGCNIYQGYLYYKDIESNELIELLKKNN